MMELGTVLPWPEYCASMGWPLKRWCPFRERFLFCVPARRALATSTIYPDPTWVTVEHAVLEMGFDVHGNHPFGPEFRPHDPAANPEELRPPRADAYEEPPSSRPSSPPPEDSWPVNAEGDGSWPADGDPEHAHPAPNIRFETAHPRTSTSTGHAHTSIHQLTEGGSTQTEDDDLLLELLQSPIQKKAKGDNESPAAEPSSGATSSKDTSERTEPHVNASDESENVPKKTLQIRRE